MRHAYITVSENIDVDVDIDIAEYIEEIPSDIMAEELSRRKVSPQKVVPMYGAADADPAAPYPLAFLPDRRDLHAALTHALNLPSTSSPDVILSHVRDILTT